MSHLESFQELCKDWFRLKWSQEKVHVALIIVPIFTLLIMNTPALLLIVGLSSVYLRLAALARWICRMMYQIVSLAINQISKNNNRNGKALSGILDNSRNSKEDVELMKPMGSVGLPLIGETVSFQVNPSKFLSDRRNLYGDIFSTSIDFSGTFLAARKVYCIFESPGVFHMAPTASANPPKLSKPPLSPPLSSSKRLGSISEGVGVGRRQILMQEKVQVLGYSGFFGSSYYGGVLVSAALPALAERVLKNPELLDAWEDCCTPIIQCFLRRLVCEGSSFNFTDRTSELACELVGSIFLNITGFSPSLHRSLQAYHQMSCNSYAINASLPSRKEIMLCLHAAIAEENKRYFCRDWAEYNADTESQTCGLGILGILLDTSAEVLHEQESLFRAYMSTATRAGAAEALVNAVQVDLLFVFLVELVHPALSVQLQHLSHSILTEKSPSRTNTNTNATSRKLAIMKDLPPQTASPSVMNRNNKKYNSNNHQHNNHNDHAHGQPEPSQPTKHHPQQLASVCGESYKAYLTARQLVGNLSGSGLARFSWASTLIPDHDDDDDEFDDNVLDDSSYVGIDSNHSIVDVGARESAGAGAGAAASSQGVPGQSSIGNYLLSQLSWPLSPIPPLPSSIRNQTTYTTDDIITQHRSSVISSSASTLAAGSHRTAINAKKLVKDLPVATSCEGKTETDSEHEDINQSPIADSELEYSISSHESGCNSSQYVVHADHMVTPPRPDYSATPAATTTTTTTTPTAITPTRSPIINQKRGVTSEARSMPGSYLRYRRQQQNAVSPYRTSASKRAPPSALPGSILSNSDSYSRSKINSKNKLIREEADGREAGSPCRTSWRYRESLIIKYVTSIKDLVSLNKKNSMDAVKQQPHHTQFTLAQCKQNHTISAAGKSSPLIHLQKGDLVLQVFADGENYQRTDDNIDTQIGDLGLFSDLVLSIFAHELVTGFDWEVQQQSIPDFQCGAGVCSYEIVHRKKSVPSLTRQLLASAASLAHHFLPNVCVSTPLTTSAHDLNHQRNAHRKCPATAAIAIAAVPPAVKVRKFRSSAENIAFLVRVEQQQLGGEKGLQIGGGWAKSGSSVHYVGGEEEDDDDDIRYFSDGL